MIPQAILCEEDSSGDVYKDVNMMKRGMAVPRFSVVIPAYNVGSVIGETIESVLNQTFTDFEVVVVNDGSTDDTAQALERFQDSRLFVHHISNQGVSHARNLAISLARGTYIAFLDSDDVWAPSHLERAAEFFATNPQVAWWSSRSYKAVTPRDYGTQPVASTEILSYYGRLALRANSSTTILLAATAKELLPMFPETMKHMEDWAAWMSFAHRHPLMGYYPVKDVMYRTREGSATTNPNNEVKPIMDKYMALAHHILALEGSHPQSRLLYRARVMEAWRVFFRHLNLRGYEEELLAQREILGTPVYLAIRLLIATLNLTNRMVCRILRELIRMQEYKLRLRCRFFRASGIK